MNKEDMRVLIEDFLGDWCETLRHEILCNLDKIGSDISLLPSSELLVDTPYANEAKSVRLMDREGFTRVFEEPRTGHWMSGSTICPCCGEDKFKDLDADIWANWYPNYCPNCGAKMER